MDMENTHQPPLPTFLVIGAQKSATRWLRVNLGLHPGVYVAKTEIEYFDHQERFTGLGPSWYRGQFSGWRDEAVVGEATPGYMMWRNNPAAIAERIAVTIPDVRLIAILRNPVDRAYSAMLHHKGRGRLPDDYSLMQSVQRVAPEGDRLGLVSGGWYAASLSPYFARFGDRLLVLLHDDVGVRPQALYQEAVRHVGADAGFVPPNLTQVRFSNRDPSQSDTTSEVSQEDRIAVFEYFASDIAKLEEMIQRDLSIWRPTT